MNIVANGMTAFVVEHLDVVLDWDEKDPKPLRDIYFLILLDVLIQKLYE